MTKKPPAKVEPTGVAPGNQVFQLIIEYHPETGELRCNAPPDGLLALGMLEVAKEIINARSRGNLRKSNIITPMF